MTILDSEPGRFEDVTPADTEICDTDPADPRGETLAAFIDIEQATILIRARCRRLHHPGGVANG